MFPDPGVSQPPTVMSSSPVSPYLGLIQEATMETTMEATMQVTMENSLSPATTLLPLVAATTTPPTVAAATASIVTTAAVKAATAATTSGTSLLLTELLSTLSEVLTTLSTEASSALYTGEPQGTGTSDSELFTLGGSVGTDNFSSWGTGLGVYNSTAAVTTMNFMNSSEILTSDGGILGGGGASYRVAPPLNGSVLLSNDTMWDSTGLPPPFHWNCALFDFFIEAVFMGFLCAFGFTGNTLSMICLWRDKSKTATPFLLVSLELADTLFLVTVLLLRVLTSVHSFTGWLNSVMTVFPYIGSYVYACALIAETGSIYLTILVTVNRYVSVCRPYEASNLCSIYHARRHVVLVAAFSIVFNLPRFFEYSVVQVTHKGTNETGPRAVMTDFARNIIYQIVYANALYFLVMFAVPLVTLICLNYKLIKALRKTKKKRAQLISSSTLDSQSRSEDDITLVLIVVVIVFIISQTPALITQSLFSFLPEKTRVCPNAFFYYERISDLMVVSNASMNFIIYCFCSTKFRQILRNLLCKRELDSPEQSENQSRVTKIRLSKSRGAQDSMV